ncbi:MAG: asparagine synthase (glutamine-hydrolyzing) [Verrucomicrobiota bacterium]
MCGIAALFAYSSDSPEVQERELTRIRDSMRVRGPDGEGSWFDPRRRVGLGHRRLSIIDLSSGGAQPMLYPERDLAITFNGEIYNYQELKKQLETKGHRFQSQSDTEVLLHLYAEYGPEILKKLRGMFAFAIWDGKKQELFLARDPFGIKPLYYSDNGKTIRVASQVKALIAGGEIDLTPAPAGHVGFFLWGHLPDPFTLYKNIRALPAGSSMTITRNGASSIHSFCNISDILANAEHLQSSILHPPSSAAILRETLLDSVRHHLIADVPVGVFLSSGMDSTTLAALASELGSDLRTVTLAFEEFKGTDNDETPLAEEVARHYGAKHQTIRVTRHDFEEDLKHLLDSMDQPTNDGVNSFFISKAAAQAGLKVALSGLGGDELFGGYPSFTQIPRMVNSTGLFQSLPGLGRSFRFVSAPVMKRFTSPKYAGLLEYGGSYGGAYLLRRGMFMPWELPEFLDGDLVRQGWNDLQPLACLHQTESSIDDPFLKVSALEMSWYMRNQLLRDTDWAGMAHSLEIRTPLVDVDLLSRLSPLLANSSRPDKRQMACTPGKPLPAAVLSRRKTGFVVPVRQWLSEQLKEVAGETPSLDRGLRGWCKEIYRHQAGDSMLKPSKLNRRPGFNFNQDLKSKPEKKPQRVLVFRIGQLGDTIVALPAMWAARNNFPDAHFTLLCDRHPNKKYVLASDLLRGTRIFDDFLSYPVSDTATFSNIFQMTSTLAMLRKKHFDTLVYLAPSGRTSQQIARDRAYFSLAGIKHFIGMEGFSEVDQKDGSVLESDLLTSRLLRSGLDISDADQGKMHLGLTAAEDKQVDDWKNQLESDGGRPWIAIGPGSKMPAKRWPEERFEETVQQLLNKFDLWPVVFGGQEDFDIGERLIKAWGRGYNAAGALGLLPAAAALKRSALYLGNDTGTMHLANAVGTPSVAIFSSRDVPGRWYPRGPDNQVFRTSIDCEGCGLVVCETRKNECLKRIEVTEVVLASETILQKVLTQNGQPLKTTALQPQIL